MTLHSQPAESWTSHRRLKVKRACAAQAGKLRVRRGCGRTRLRGCSDILSASFNAPTDKTIYTASTVGVMENSELTIEKGMRQFDGDSIDLTHEGIIIIPSSPPPQALLSRNYIGSFRLSVAFTP